MGASLGKVQARTHLQFVGGERMEAMISRLRDFSRDVVCPPVTACGLYTLQPLHLYCECSDIVSRFLVVARLWVHAKK